MDWRRDGATWSAAAPWDADLEGLLRKTTTQGYTGHEMAESVGIIHMNGRIYDPHFARFLQADPFVQNPQDLQSWNRYSYVLNNPLAYTDPSGYFSFGDLLRTAAAVAITVYSGGTAAGASWGLFGSSITAGSAESFAVMAVGGVEVCLTQHQIEVSYAASNTGTAAGLQMAATSPTVAAGGFAAGAAAGLIGSLIDSAVTAHRSSVAKEMEKPIHAHTRDLPIDDLVQESLEGMDRKRFAERIVFEWLDKTEGEDEKHLKPGTHILVLTPHYSVSYEGTFFSYVLDAKLVDRTQDAKGRIQSTVRYRQMFEYVLPQGDLPGGASWGRLSAEQWKDIIATATAESVAMLNHDIGANPSDVQPRKLYENQIVLLEEGEGARSWVRTRIAMLSVPSSRLKDKT